MKLYKYRITINNDNDINQYILDTKDEICKMLNVSLATLNSIIAGRIKNKYNFLKIERIYMPPNVKGYEEDHKQAVHREACRKYFLKTRKLKNENKESIKNQIINNIKINEEN